MNYTPAAIMDRNLGAMEASQVARGLTYQFGRTAPFFSSNTKLYKYDLTSGDIISTKHISIGIQEDFGYSVSNPQAFINSGVNWNKSDRYLNNTWMNPDWNYSTQEGSTTKSLFDPCPVGWRIPAAGIWLGIYTIREFNSSNASYKFYMNGISGEYFYLPRISETIVSISRWRGYTSSTPNSSYPGRRRCFVWTDTSIEMELVYGGSDSYYGYHADAAVRCVQE